MQRRFLPVLALVFLMGFLDSVAHAHAAAGIPIIWGHGETVSELGNLPDDVREAVAKDLGQEVSVGFVYSRFHLYYADMWTWNGRHVLYHGDRCWSPDDAQWRQLLGTSVEEKFGKPLQYRFPIGLTLLVSITVLWNALPRIFPTPEKKLQRLSQDARYASALESVFPTSDPALRTTIDPMRFDAAIVSLRGHGISESKARRNLQMLVGAVCADREQCIQAALLAAGEGAESGQFALSVGIMEQLVAALPTSDPRYEDTARLLAKFREVAANAVEPAGESPAEESPTEPLP